MWDVYDFVQPLGSGTFGVVREVKSKRGNRRFAVKTIPVAADIEMVLMLKLEHEHIVRLEHVILEAQEMHLIMDLCSGGDLQAWCLGCVNGRRVNHFCTNWHIKGELNFCGLHSKRA